MVKAVIHLLPRPAWYEVLRIRHIPTMPMDNPGRELGTQVDGGQRKTSGVFRDALFPRGDERVAVLHYRWLYQEPETFRPRANP